jgi:large subunit ribosomal protein L25
MAITHTITAQKREITGKKTQDLRDQGVLPVVIYGPKTENISLQINTKEFAKTLKEVGHTGLINLDIAGKKTPVLVRDLQFDPMTNEVIHVDFYAPDMTQTTEVAVPLVFVGEALAVKDLHGELVKNMDEMEIEALPQDIPHEISVDISVLNTFEDRILAGDIKLPTGVKLLTDAEQIVALVTAHQEVEEELATPIEENVESVEKIEKEKKVEIPEEGGESKE